MLTSLAIYVCTLAAFTSMTALACGSVIALAGVVVQWEESKLELIRTPDVSELERLFGCSVNSAAPASRRGVRSRLLLTDPELSCAIAMALFLLALLVLSFVGMSLAATSARQIDPPSCDVNC